jgi:hypothetical protein
MNILHNMYLLKGTTSHWTSILGVLKLSTHRKPTGI